MSDEIHEEAAASPTQAAHPALAHKSPELWLAVSAKLLSSLFAFGVLGDGSLAAQIAGLAAAVLTALGYTVWRTRSSSSSPPAS